MRQREGVAGLGWYSSDSSNLLSFTLSTCIVLSPRRDYTPLGLSIDTWNKLKRTKKKLKQSQWLSSNILLSFCFNVSSLGSLVGTSTLIVSCRRWLSTCLGSLHPLMWFDRLASGPLGCSMRHCASTWHRWVQITTIGFASLSLAPTIVPHHWLPLAVIGFKLSSLGWIHHSKV